MGAAMRALDWSQTLLGPINSWPQSLRTSVSTCLNSRFPILIWWGPELVMLYNDSYRDIIGGKHPAALGRPGRECWPEIWHIIGPMLEGVLQRGEATWSNDLLLLLERNGYSEECYFTFSYSPIRDESGGIGGVFTPVAETTDHVIGERRLDTLRNLAARASQAHAVKEACAAAIDTLAGNPHDVPFATLYLFDECRTTASLISSMGINAGPTAARPVVQLSDLPAPVRDLVIEPRLTMFENLAPTMGALFGAASDLPPQPGILLPILLPAETAAAGVVLAGISPHKRLDASYKTFFELVGGHISTAIANAGAYEAERKRIESLAEIDRMKTVFFSNVSHEFRTPLTLMLGPLEEMLRHPGATADLEELQLMHRNGIRLLKLVNTLLDFSRIEAGRVEAVYEPTDLAGLTADIASAFRSAMENAGLEYVIDCPPLSEPAYVDRDMWEKIVLNLISNAFKFTLAGRVGVRLTAAAENRVELSIEDTGVGIPAHEVPRVFERFHRIEGTPGRSHEGTGIGLALVHELVKLHGGTIHVESTQGAGSKFSVSLPLGHAHLQEERVSTASRLSSTGAAASAYVNEAMRWLPASQQGPERISAFAADSVQAPHIPESTGRILLADDNADMRAYVHRLLGRNYQVQSVANGAEALAAILHDPPDLVLADVMMPKLDGFELIRELRAQESVRTIPVILLSARAGEDARIEGLKCGADDYLVKPFTGRELLARVDTRLAMSRLRSRAEAQERKLRAEAEAAGEAVQKVNETLAAANADLEQFAFSAAHDLREPLRAVCSCCELLQRRFAGKLGGDGDQLIEFAVDGALRMDALLNGLLTYIHAASEKPEEAVSFEAAFDVVALNLRSTIEETGALITHSDLPVLKEMPAVHAQQILQNLIGNALKYRGSDPPRVHVSARQQGGSWIFSVRDNGIGIAPEYQEYIFGLFRRVDSSRQNSGAGIGLALCKKLIGRYGGRIWVESEKGKGSTFYFSIPEH